MKTIIVSILTVVLASSALALNRPQLDDRIQSLTAKFTAMEQNPATRVPAGELARAKGIILLDRTKGTLILGVHGGNGVALTREPAGQWSSVGFVSSGGASLGPQIGGSKDFFVILLMSQSAVDTLKQPVIDFTAQASGTAGTEHTGARTMLGSHPPIMIYSERNGLYAGASIKGGSVKADKDANAAYYGHPASMSDILFAHQVTQSPAEEALIAKIDEYSR